MVDRDAGLVEERLAGRVWSCPLAGCSGRLGPWGWARQREVWTGLSGRGEPVGVRPRRAKCGECGVTQVLLDERFLSRRCDGVEVIAREVEMAGQGMGFRKIAAVDGRPESTVRDRVRAARRVAERVAAVVGQVVMVTAGDAAGVVPRGSSGLTGLVGVLAGLAVAAGRAAAGWLQVGASVCRCQILCLGWWAGMAQHELALTGRGVAGGGWAGGLGASGPP